MYAVGDYLSATTTMATPHNGGAVQPCLKQLTVDGKGHHRWIMVHATPDALRRAHAQSEGSASVSTQNANALDPAKLYASMNERQAR
jgi:hypothetical protein